VQPHRARRIHTGIRHPDQAAATVQVHPEVHTVRHPIIPVVLHPAHRAVIVRVLHHHPVVQGFQEVQVAACRQVAAAAVAVPGAPAGLVAEGKFI
jgi:hypothetical protein